MGNDNLRNAQTSVKDLPAGVMVQFNKGKNPKQCVSIDFEFNGIVKTVKTSAFYGDSFAELAQRIRDDVNEFFGIAETGSCATACGEPSYDGKHRDEQERTYAKGSSEQTKLELEQDLRLIVKRQSILGIEPKLIDVLRMLQKQTGVHKNSFSDYCLNPKTTSAVLIGNYYITPCSFESVIKRFNRDVLKDFKAYAQKYDVQTSRKYKSLVQACFVDAVAHGRLKELDFKFRVDERYLPKNEEYELGI